SSWPCRHAAGTVDARHLRIAHRVASVPRIRHLRANRGTERGRIASASLLFSAVLRERTRASLSKSTSLSVRFDSRIARRQQAFRSPCLSEELVYARRQESPR